MQGCMYSDQNLTISKPGINYKYVNNWRISTSFTLPTPVSTYACF
jgi:hypothetical protein